MGIKLICFFCGKKLYTVKFDIVNVSGRTVARCKNYNNDTGKCA